METQSINTEAYQRIKTASEEKSMRLDLAGLDLEIIPSELFELSFINELDLSSNNLKKIPKEISKLANLKKIDLSYNKISSLPLVFANLNSLNEVRILSCKIKNFPSSLLRINNLQKLNLSNNKISLIPKTINHLVNLDNLWLHNNPITELPLDKHLLSKISALSITSTRISNFAFLKDLNSIQALGLSGKNDSLNDAFKLKTLKRLILVGYQNASLNGIENLNLLEELVLFDSTFNEIETVGDLSNLNELYVHRCNDIRLPQNLGKLINLERIRIDSSELEELPGSIGKLKSLKSLSLNFNKLQNLPMEIGELSKLESLSLDYNDLITIPTEIAKLTNLKDFSIKGNTKLISPPQAVITQGKDAVLSYLKDLLQSENIWASRMVLVGEGGVGKSCLLDSLLENPFNQNNNTTHGINIEELKMLHPKSNQEMTLKVWDFGGQDIYHATHQFYLTNHSLFILVWSARLGYEAGKVYKWLEVISALAPDSPILIVATNSDPRGADLPKGDIENQFGKRISFFEVDNKTRNGIEILKESIIDKAATLKYMGVERPRSWINSISEIKSSLQRQISKENIESIFRRNGVSEELFEPLLYYLHDLGEILYFPDEEVLSDTIILKPSWVSKQIAKILDSTEISHNSGFLTKKVINEIWNDLDNPMQEKLIVLMEKFDLSYKTKDDKNISLVVEKLKFEEPAEYATTWDLYKDKNEIAFKYELDIIPPGIPTWFIARTHRFSAKIHWRYGVILKDESGSNIALVLTSPERKEVWLKVRGNTPFYFFAQLRDTLELTFKRFEGLKINTLVPCPGHNGSPCNHLFDLKQLEKRLSQTKPKTTIECPESTENVEVLQMLFGLSFAPENNFLVNQITQQIEKALKKKSIVDEEEIKKFIELEFIKSYRIQQEIMDLTCPNTFILAKKDLEFLDKDLALNHYNLHLCCQMPGNIHTVGDPYLIKVPKTWLKVLGPYYNKLIASLKMTLPILIPGLKSVIEKLEYEELSSKLEMLKEVSNSLPLFDKSANVEQALNDITSEDLSIRLVRRILDEVDHEHIWRGLERIVSPEGHIIWLCPEHYRKYK